MALRLGDILVEKMIISPEQLQQAVKEQQRTGEMLGQVLLRMKLVSEEKLLQAISEQQGIAFVNLKEVGINDVVIKNIPAKLIWHYKIMPINIEGNILTVAVSNPFDMWPLDDLETNLGYKVERVLATSADILEAIKKYYGVGADTIEGILSGSPETVQDLEEASAKETVEDLEKMAESATVIKLVNQILRQAINDRATDIHIERFREETILRYRIDGILYDIQVSENIKFLYHAIVSRVKIISNLDIVERRLPQDGRAKVKVGDKEYELRVSVMPTLYGENIAVRILPTSMLFNLTELGISPKDLETLEDLIKKPHGIIFVTGPTGSGKTTTLYACLSRLNSRERKIVTIEDPIEYELKGISQTQINSKIDLTFARVLRSMLRHDPDVMMVGEVRDLETAEITIQTALTGHLVFSTIHTNDAASGATRLIDIGVEPYLVASSVIAFIAQRLVRMICPNCREQVKIDLEKLKIEGVSASKEITAWQGRGCKACGNTGYAGRTGIYEIMPVGEEIDKLILRKASSDEIKARAIELGMHSLKQDGWDKVVSGITTIEEVMRVTQFEK